MRLDLLEVKFEQFLKTTLFMCGSRNICTPPRFPSLLWKPFTPIYPFWLVLLITGPLEDSGIVFK